MPQLGLYPREGVVASLWMQVFKNKSFEVGLFNQPTGPVLHPVLCKRRECIIHGGDIIHVDNARHVQGNNT
jgi:hypothetical protein